MVDTVVQTLGTEDMEALEAAEGMIYEDAAVKGIEEAWMI